MRAKSAMSLKLSSFWISIPYGHVEILELLGMNEARSTNYIIFTFNFNQKCLVSILKRADVYSSQFNPMNNGNLFRRPKLPTFFQKLKEHCIIFQVEIYVLINCLETDHTS